MSMLDSMRLLFDDHAKPSVSGFDRVGVPFSCDSSSCWNEPSSVIYNIIMSASKEFHARELYKKDGRYYVKERNGRTVYVGKLNMKRQIIVSPCEDGSFTAALFILEVNEELEQFAIAIPFPDIKKQAILPYLFSFRRNPDCPPNYITAAFLQEMFACKSELMQLPTRPGWQLTTNRPFFASAETMIPQLLPYYSQAIQKRELVDTMRDLRSAAMQLAACLPASWKYKLLLCISIASILLPFWAESGLIPDHLFAVIPSHPQNERILIRLVKNQEFRTTAVCRLTEPKTKLLAELNSVNDGTFVIRDNTLIENKRKRAENLELLLHDLRQEQTDTRRHLMVIITDKPANIPPEMPALYLDFLDAPELVETPGLQGIVGEFISAFIKAISEMDAEDNMLTRALKISSTITKTIRNEESWMMQRMLIATAEILREVGVVSDDEIRDIRGFFKRYEHEECDVDLSLANEFISVLSAQITSGEIPVVKQEGPPYFNLKRLMIFQSNDDCVNFNEETMNWLVLTQIKSTRRRNKVLSALSESDVLNSNNGYKRNLRVEVAPGKSDSISVYSIPKTCLSASCQTKLDALALKDFLFSGSKFPIDFIPIVQTSGGVAGRVVTADTDEAESIFITGQTRSGKTFLEMAQALIRLDAGQLVYVFDQTDAFCKGELLKSLPEDVITDRFLFWDIGTKGLPVDVLSLKHCKNLREKRARLEGILMVAAALTGDVQQITLCGRLTRVINGIEKGKVHDLSDILQYFDREDPEQEKIRARLAVVAGDLDGLPRTVQSWSDLPKDKIIVFSTGEDGILKSSRLFDILLASLYAYKQHQRTQRMTIILDELTDLSLEHTSPIDILLRKGGKLRLSVILASQRFSAENDCLGRSIGNCSIKVFFHPMDSDLSVISKKYKLDKARLANLEQGECYAVGPFFNNRQQKNCPAIIKGRAYTTHHSSD